MVINRIALRDQHNFEGSSNLHVSTQEIDNRHQVTVFLTQACKREESKKIIGKGERGLFCQHSIGLSSCWRSLIGSQ